MARGGLTERGAAVGGLIALGLLAGARRSAALAVPPFAALAVLAVPWVVELPFLAV